MVKYLKVKMIKEGEKDVGLVDILVLYFGYKNYVFIDCKWCFICGESCMNVVCYDGYELFFVLDSINSLKFVWVDIGYCFVKNEIWFKV